MSTQKCWSCDTPGDETSTSSGINTVDVRGRPFDSEGGGAGKFCRARIFIFEVLRVRKFIFNHLRARLFISFIPLCGIWRPKYLFFYFQGGVGQNIYFHCYPGQNIYLQNLPGPPQNQMVVSLVSWCAIVYTTVANLL